MKSSLICIFCLSIGACTFPDPPTSANVDGATDGASDVGTDSGAVDSGLDSAIVEDTNPAVDAFPEINPETGNPCDLDDDGFESNAPGCGHGQLDCNDYTPQANPSVKDFVFLDPVDPKHPDVASHWDGARPGDWNCDGTIDKNYTVQETCSKGSTLNCAPSDGLDQDPNAVDCGAAANEVSCVSAGAGLLNCKPGKLTPVTMGCK